MKSKFFPFLEEGLERPAVSARDRFAWVESSFDERATSSKQEFLGISVGEKKIKIVFAVVVCLFSIFFIRSAQLQAFQGTSFSLLADRNKNKTVLLTAHRGIVYDQNLTPLAWNVPSFAVTITPADLPKDPEQKKQILIDLASRLSVSTDNLEKALAGKNLFQPTIVKDRIGYDASLALNVALEGVPAVNLVVEERREYGFSSSSPSLSHILGYTGRISEEELAAKGGAYHLNDVIGKEGVELSYEDSIHGKTGVRTVEVDALGREKQVVSEDVPVDGQNIVLTIDHTLQEVSERALAETMKKMGKKRGAVIVSDPRTGGIRALVSVPSYSNNDFAAGISSKNYSELLKDPSRPLFNRALYGEYPSGSTIKPLVAAAALQEGVVTPSTTVHSRGGLRIGEWYFPDWKSGGHGTTNLAKALAESVNTYFYMVGGGYGAFKGLGVEKLVSYFQQFGLGTPTGIDLLGERDGFVPTQEWKENVKKEPWYIGDTYHIAIGQGDIVVTPLQVNLFTQYFANGGVSYRPHLFESALDEFGNRIDMREREVVKKKIVEKRHVKAVREGLREAVVSGSARRLSTLIVSSAGKTGTAQWHSSKSPHAWFTGWAPYENPEVVITVLVEEGEEGSRAATPVAHDILKWYFSDKRKAPIDKK